MQMYLCVFYIYLYVWRSRYPLDDTGFAILEVGMFAIYATFIYAVASAYKLWTYARARARTHTRSHSS
jgi:hypothetical protein